MEAIINRFPIDLELELGASFTERTTYTGIYNISGLGFDMSFRVQCSENYYGPNCTTFCEPVEGVYTCDNEGRVVCAQDNQDPATNCTTCLSGYDPQGNCTQCLLGQNLLTNCSECLPGYDPSMSCKVCLPSYDISFSCTRSSAPDRDPANNCKGKGQMYNLYLVKMHQLNVQLAMLYT